MRYRLSRPPTRIYRARRPVPSKGAGGLNVSLDGKGNVASAGRGALLLAADLRGSGTVSSAGRADLTITAALAGKGSNASGGKADLGATMALAGKGDTANAARGLLTSTMGLAGKGANSTAGSATISTSPQVSLDGKGSAASAGSGFLILTLSLQGKGSTSAAGKADLTITAGGVVALDGKGSNATAGKASLSAALTLLGKGSVASAGRATLNVSGIIVAATHRIALGKRRAIGKRSHGIRFDDNTPPPSQSLIALMGSGGFAVAGVGSIQAALVLAGRGANASAGLGGLATQGSVDLAGRGANAVTGSAPLLRTAAFAGKGSNAATGKGLLVKTAGLGGKGSNATTGKAAMNRSVALSGKGSVASGGKASFESDLGDFPDATNTGYLTAFGSLDNLGGFMTISVNNTVLEGFRCTDGISIQADNVTLRDFYLAGGVTMDYANVGLVLEDFEIDGGGTAEYGIGFDEYTARRGNIHGSVDGCKVGESVTLEDCYIHGNLGAVDSHRDSTQSTGQGTNSGPTIIDHCTLDAVSGNGASTTVQLGDEDSVLGEIQIINCKHILTQDGINGGYPPNHVNGDPNPLIITNNVFDLSAASGNPIINYTLAHLTWTGNVDENGTPITL